MVAIKGTPGAHAPKAKSFFGYFFFKKSNFFLFFLAVVNFWPRL